MEQITFLIELWNNILEASEDSEKSVALMSVDFSKAFNRLDHGACLAKLSERGASNQTLQMVCAFLEKRTMCVRSGQLRSTVREVKGGSPQGTKLGNLLFCIAIDDICLERNDGSPERVLENAFPDQYSPRITSTPKRRHDDSFEPNPYGMRVRKFVLDDTPTFSMMKEAEYQNIDTWEIGYIDDINICEILDMRDCLLHYSTKKPRKILRARGCEYKYGIVKENGNALRLKLNPEKTQLMCFTGNKMCEISCHASVENKKLESSKSLKILGFHFDGQLNVNAQIVNLIKKFNSSVWSIVHLKRNKLNEETLVRVYKSMIRPIIEYSANVYHSMLSAEQNIMIERCQRKAMKIIYGFGRSYEDAIKEAGLETLRERRGVLFDKFCVKMSRSERFSKKWLPTREIDENERVLRKRNHYLEFRATSARLYNSPVFNMRRVLNRIC